MANVQQAFESLVAFTFIKYAGCLIERRNNSFVALKRDHSSIEEAKASIDAAHATLKNSIRCHA